MPYASPYPPLSIPQTDILSFLFPPDQTPSTDPIWIDSKDPSVSLSPAQLLQWVKRLAFGLGRAGVKKGEVVMIHTPNHVFVPVAYLGIVGGGFAFSGANPVYTVPGGCLALGSNLTNLVLRGGASAQEHGSEDPSDAPKSGQDCFGSSEPGWAIQEPDFPLLGL